MTDRSTTLTEEGISGFRGYIEAVRRGDVIDWPIDLLTDDATSTAFPQAGQIDDRGFGSKYELADYISQRLSGLPSESVDYNQGLWGWLALYYFPRLCPPDVLGRAYEYLITQFADDAGSKAGEFFPPPAAVAILLRL